MQHFHEFLVANADNFIPYNLTLSISFLFHFFFVSMSCHSAISLQDPYPQILSPFDVFWAVSLLLDTEPDWLASPLRGKAPGSIHPHTQKCRLRLIRAVNRLAVLCLGPFSLCIPSVIQKEPRSRQTRHTHACSNTSDNTVIGPSQCAATTFQLPAGPLCHHNRFIYCPNNQSDSCHFGCLSAISKLKLQLRAFKSTGQRACPRRGIEWACSWGHRAQK